MPGQKEEQLELYGWLWCDHCHEAALLLHEIGVPYTPRLMESTTTDGKKNAGYVHKIAGKIAGPTIVFPNGSWLQEPSEEELLDKLKQFEFISEDDVAALSE